jgi:hypothetical protein
MQEKTKWFHGSPHKMSILLQGSWITPFKEVAKAFSHKPKTISANNDYSIIKHDGELLGYLYEVEGFLNEKDITELNGTDKTHWLTNRDIKICLLQEVPLVKEELLLKEEIDQMRKKHNGIGFWKEDVLTKKKN